MEPECRTPYTKPNDHPKDKNAKRPEFNGSHGREGKQDVIETKVS